MVILSLKTSYTIRLSPHITYRKHSINPKTAPKAKLSLNKTYEFFISLIPEVDVYRTLIFSYFSIVYLHIYMSLFESYGLFKFIYYSIINQCTKKTKKLETWEFILFNQEYNFN